MQSTNRDRNGRAPRRLAAICTTAAIVAAISACGGGHELERFSFAGETLAVVDYAPPSPELRTGSIDVEGDDLLTAVVGAGAGAAREVEAGRARARLDSAAVLVGVRERMSRWTHERASRYLGTTTVADPAAADYLLELYVRRYGIDARRAGAARLFMQVEAVLIERRTGREAWSVEVNGHDEIGPPVRTASVVPVDIVAAGTLHALTVEHLRSELAGLTDFTADFLTNELREDLRDIRRR